ncbi:MAG: UDP-N-acetylglucosamine 2-epimerase (non-hydrolyzing) [Sphingomonadales bacterium]|jgi:UDP-N-acetylglucosamine 2-epimerase (non-hydrolysing)
MAAVPFDCPILFIAGTRPEAVKLAPIMHDLAARGQRPLLVATGQHRHLFADALRDFGLNADHDLGVMAATPDELVGRLLPPLAGLLRTLRPGWVVVQGDTSSTLAGAMAARYAGLRLAHVEAGLRTGGDDPHPEEMHRRLVAQMAQLHFAPTAAAAAALRREGVCEGIHVTGNSGIDALLMMQARLEADRTLLAAALAPFRGISPRRPWVVATVHRRENQGDRLLPILRALGALAADAEIIIPVHPSPAVAGPMATVLGDVAGVHLLPPLPYASFVALMGRAALALTDSGGVQEEAPAIGLPCLVLREATERRETLASGNAVLVGRDPAAITAAARALLADGSARHAMAEPAFPYGAGGAAAAISRELLRPGPATWAQSSGSLSRSDGHHRSRPAGRH